MFKDVIDQMKDEEYINRLERKNKRYRDANEKLSEQNQHYRNLLKSLSNTHNIASKIMKKQPDKKIIDANDLLQYILRKINDELERGTE